MRVDKKILCSEIDQVSPWHSAFHYTHVYDLVVVVKREQVRAVYRSICINTWPSKAKKGALFSFCWHF